MSKISLAWVGQNATTGRPNERTGRMSMWGKLIAFDDRKTRDRYVDCFYNQSNPSEFAVKVCAKSARKYCLGMSMRDYKEYVSAVCSKYNLVCEEDF